MIAHGRQLAGMAEQAASASTTLILYWGSVVDAVPISTQLWATVTFGDLDRTGKESGINSHWSNSARCPEFPDAFNSKR